MTKNRGRIGQGGSKAHQSLKALGGREGEGLVFGRPQEAGQASKRPGTEELKACHPKQINVQSRGSVATTEVGVGEDVPP